MPECPLQPKAQQANKLSTWPASDRLAASASEIIDRVVRIAILLSAIATLAACGGQQPIDCTNIDMAVLERCWEQNGAKGEASAFIACLPFSERLSTQGVWVVGFEKNDFFEGKRPPPAEILWSGSTGAALIVDEGVFDWPIPVQAFEVAIVGRRALCPVGGLNEYPIAVEKLRVKRRIG